MKVVETPVIIVGAGPVGLGLALDLAWRGRQCLIVERSSAAPVLHPRAGGVAARTMEFCRRWGVADDVRNAGFPQDRRMDVVFCTGLDGFELSRQLLPPLGAREELPFSPEHRERCPQIWFDPILARAVGARPEVTVLYGHTLLEFQQSDSDVRATVREDATGEILTIVSSYLVGCDGNDSGIRNALGIEVEGEQVLSYSVNAVVRAPRLNELNRMGEGVRYLFVGPGGTWANMTAIDGSELWRFTLIGGADKLDLGQLDMAAHIRRAWGDDIPFEVLTVAPWRRKEINAVRYRCGRVFLAGDAAHTMSPTGGAGMNTGMGDAADLGWKLDAVLSGWGGDGLLQSYERERRPVGARNARWSSGNFKNWRSRAEWPDLLDSTPKGENCRREVGESFLLSLRDEWLSWGIQLGYCYDDSPICVPDGSAALPDEPGDYVQTTRPGSRAPHAWLEPGKSTIDLYGRDFVLMDFTESGDAGEAILNAGAAAGVPIRRECIRDPRVARLYETALVLVRPDGHVAWRGDEPPGDAVGLMKTVSGQAVSDREEPSINGTRHVVEVA